MNFKFSAYILIGNRGISLIVKHVIYTHGSAERNRHSLPFLNNTMKVLTADFDSTLAETVTTGWGGTSLQPIQRILDFVRDKAANGWAVHVVTFRSEDDRQEVTDFIKGYKLPVRSVHCTEGKNKTPFLKKLGSALHIDDSVEVCVLAFMAGIECLLVDHGQDDTNEMAKLFPKI